MITGTNTPTSLPVGRVSKIAKFALFAVVAYVSVLGQAHAQVTSTVIFVHGFDPNYKNEPTYQAQNCGGVFGNMMNYYKGSAPSTVSLVTFGLYDRSSNCNFYANNSAFNKPGSTLDTHFGKTTTVAVREPYAFSNDKSIRHLGYRLAWFIYNNYSKNGKTVSIVGHSMGGLVARYAVGQTSARHPDFPPFIYVRGLALLGTPSGGSIWGNVCTAATPILQCKELAAGSTFLNELNNTVDRGNSGVPNRVSLNSADGYDGVASENLDLVGTQVQYFNPGYRHGDYMHDTNGALDARITYFVVSRNSSGVLTRTRGTSTTAERAVRMAFKYTVL